VLCPKGSWPNSTRMCTVTALLLRTGPCNRKAGCSLVYYRIYITHHHYHSSFITLKITSIYTHHNSIDWPLSQPISRCHKNSQRLSFFSRNIQRLSVFFAEVAQNLSFHKFRLHGLPYYLSLILSTAYQVCITSLKFAILCTKSVIQRLFIKKTLGNMFCILVCCYLKDKFYLSYFKLTHLQAFCLSSPHLSQVVLFAL